MNLLYSLILLRVYAEVKYETYMLLVALNYLIMAAFSLLQFYTIFLAYSHWIDKKDANSQPTSCKAANEKLPSDGEQS